MTVKNLSKPRIALIVPKTPLIDERRALKKLWEGNRGFRESSFFFPLPNLALITLASYVLDAFEVE